MKLSLNGKEKLISFMTFIELLGDGAVEDWKRFYYNNEDAYHEEDDE